MTIPLSDQNRRRLRAMAAEVRDIGDALDLWSRRHATDPESQDAAAAQAVRLWTAAGSLVSVADSSGTGAGTPPKTP